MELCEGGELLDKILDSGTFTEVQAAILMQQIVRAVFYMHENQVCHRDLKPENFLFKSKDPIENNVLKIIDFGLSCHSKPGAVHTQIAGSAQYVAPQVLQRRYDRMCDMWSCGCIMYVLLCGQSPFSGRTEQEVMAKVSSGEFSFKGRNWGHVSADAKDLIRSLLKMDPSRRLSAEQALSHVWIKHRAPLAEPVGLEDGLLRKLRCFRETCKLRKAALHVIAGHLEDTSPTKSLREIFTALDTNEDGYLCMNELTWGLERRGVREVPADLDEIFEGVDFTGTGAIDYTEFLAANLDRKSYLNEDACRHAFSVFDRDGDGKLSKHELTKVLCAGSTAPEGEESGVQHYDGMDFQEFVRLLRSEPLDAASERLGSEAGDEAEAEAQSRCVPFEAHGR
uniref:Non-specific serine/threonine protein kinase n=1 Tax=Alexandrium catenella TaxID=2925 RepID=A0A7S1QHN5_ALECA|mmetsp:Transcript_33117/g.89636  ORF Transcript_33117/g.89636 Transcript_33117/m.89636 type:complete len:395 (+) Transcript_33117:1-1185(+)